MLTAMSTSRQAPCRRRQGIGMQRAGHQVTRRDIGTPPTGPESTWPLRTWTSSRRPVNAAVMQARCRIEWLRRGLRRQHRLRDIDHRTSECHGHGYADRDVEEAIGDCILGKAEDQPSRQGADRSSREGRPCHINRPEPLGSAYQRREGSTSTSANATTPNRPRLAGTCR